MSINSYHEVIMFLSSITFQYEFFPKKIKIFSHKSHVLHRKNGYNKGRTITISK